MPSEFGPVEESIALDRLDGPNLNSECCVYPLRLRNRINPVAALSGAWVSAGGSNGVATCDRAAEKM